MNRKDFVIYVVDSEVPAVCHIHYDRDEEDVDFVEEIEERLGQEVLRIGEVEWLKGDETHAEELKVPDDTDQGTPLGVTDANDRELCLGDNIIFEVAVEFGEEPQREVGQIVSRSDTAMIEWRNGHVSLIWNLETVEKI